jgi:5'-deoxynucleotidase
MSKAFYAILSRMKYIRRWALMRNTRAETVCEHSYDVAVLAHALAVLTNRRFGGRVDTETCVLLALYHDATEIFTGDMPTPVKYRDPVLRDAYKRMETQSAERLLTLLPDDLRADYAPLLLHDTQTPEGRLVKAADKLSALIKCAEELQQGNGEFAAAYRTTEQTLREMRLPAVDCFLEEFLPAFRLSLDDLSSEEKEC